MISTRIQRFIHSLKFRRFLYCSKFMRSKNSAMLFAFYMSNALVFIIGFLFCHELSRLGFLK